MEESYDEFLEKLISLRTKGKLENIKLLHVDELAPFIKPYCLSPQRNDLPTFP